jgi:hypothetical protein
LVNELNFPYGLAKTVEEEEEATGERIFVIDNSGSTVAGDGQLLKSFGGTQKMCSVSRWEEIQVQCSVREYQFS